jgi:tRNA threonylcarbamoyl adenosine modification protein (Sua5/YciO/YrdC/YwlC family)
VRLATQIRPKKHTRLRTVLQHMRLTAGQKLESMWKELAAEHPDLCLPERTAPDLSPSMLSDSTDTDPGEDSTPPGPASAPSVLGERIRPGATLAHRRDALHGGKPNAGALLPTPEPQEPDNQTEDPSLNESKVDTPSNPLREPAFPPPPRLSDLTPLGLSRPPANDATESFTPPRLTALAPPYDEDSDEEVAAHSPVEKALDLAESYLETKVFHVEHSEPDEDVLAHAMMVLLEGGIVALPTDTVYGLAADATNPDAVRRLYETKGYEPSRKSLSVLIHSSDMLENLVREVPASVESVLEQYWPGGLTVLFYKHPDMLPTVSESPSIAVRIPKDALALKVLAMVERPLVVINAAVGSAPAASDASAVIDRFDGKIDCVLDGGPCKSSETSTVLSVLTEPFEILREGTIPARDLRKILGARLKD